MMDFSVFDKRKKTLNETCEVLVVDFVNKKVVHKTIINNLAPQPPQQWQELTEAISQVSNITQKYIENSQLNDTPLEDASGQ